MFGAACVSIRSGLDFQQHIGAKLRVTSDDAFRTLAGAQPTADGWSLFLSDDAGGIVQAQVGASAESSVELLTEDGAGDASHVLAGLWAQWMRASTLDAKATVLATSPLIPYAHQNNAVYGAMLPQPLLRFLLWECQPDLAPPCQLDLAPPGT